jgi:hypothetical protein
MHTQSAGAGLLFDKDTYFRLGEQEYLLKELERLIGTSFALFILPRTLWELFYIKYGFRLRF